MPSLWQAIFVKTTTAATQQTNAVMLIVATAKPDKPLLPSSTDVGTSVVVSITCDCVAAGVDWIMTCADVPPGDCGALSDGPKETSGGLRVVSAVGADGAGLVVGSISPDATRAS